MVSTAGKLVPSSVPRWHKAFLAMLPIIRDYARGASRVSTRSSPGFDAGGHRQCPCGLRQAVPARPSRVGVPDSVGSIRIAQVRDNCRVGNKLNIKDVLSPYCQAKKHVVVERLDKFDDEENAWRKRLYKILARRQCPTSSAFASISPTGSVRSSVETGESPRHWRLAIARARWREVQGKRRQGFATSP